MPKSIILPDCAKINEEIIERLSDFLDAVPPRRLKNHIWVVFTQYLIHEHDSLPMDFDKVACDLYWLFDFLILAEEELAK